MSEQPVYKIVNLSKKIEGPGESVSILKDLSFSVAARDALAVVGASGSGKTTLLHLMGGLDVQSEGTIYFRGRDISAFTWLEKARFRNQNIGFVFQFHHLLPEFNTLENVAMPGLIQGLPAKKIQALAGKTLELVGLKGQKKQPVVTLSGGERQLAAIARALVLEPDVILADEPTGNLDAENGKRVGDLLVKLNLELQTTLVLVTHNFELAERMQRKIHLKSGGLLQV